MNKSEIISAMAEKADLTKKDAGAVLDAFIKIVSEEVAKDEKIQLIGFGTFELARRAQRDGKNPSTGEKIVIPASKTVRFKSGKALKDALN